LEVFAGKLQVAIYEQAAGAKQVFTADPASSTYKYTAADPEFAI